MTAERADRQGDEPLGALRAGGKRAMALAIAQLEAAFERDDTQDLLDAAARAARAQVLGITGPPGVGKSTLTSAVIASLRERGRTVGVIAVDPSSARSGGALLGDRMRFDLDPGDQGIFVRSMAARSHLGGLATLTRGAVVLMRAIYDVVIVETVGVGQSETEISTVADTVLLCIQPGSGDSIQYMKSGIVEIPDVVVVSKADLGTLAEKAKADLEAALSFGQPQAGGSGTQVLMASGATGQGIDQLIEVVDEHFARLQKTGQLDRRRSDQASAWVRAEIQEEFGRRGVARALQSASGFDVRPGDSPFSRIRELSRTLSGPSH